MHGPPAGQTVPHAPQLRLLLRRSTQLLPQRVWPPAVLQPATHEPAEQDSPGPQLLPHPPQLRGSICVFEHVVPQSESLPEHEHWLPMQLAPAGHGWLQAPQLLGSLVRSMQELPHVVRPAPPSTAAPPSTSPQLKVQTPSSHTVPGAQTTPQPPQLFGSLCVRAHTPLHLMPALAHWQLPLWHVVPCPQTVSHPPQLELSDCSSTHAPPHDERPAEQLH